jgi:calcineurin-like phosphoesterase family protein
MFGRRKMSQVYFNSDLHLGHRKVIEFHDNFRAKCLGVGTIEQHDEMIYDLWNDTVKKRDIIYILGDVGYDLEGILKMPGHKRLLLGNHDERHVLDYLEYFDNIIGPVKYKRHWLNHIPQVESELYGRPVIHGHTHSTGIADPRYINVCVEMTRGKPVNYQDIKNGKFKTYDKVNRCFEDIEW